MLQVLVVISQSFVVEKRNGAMQKLLIKKRIKKNGQVSEISKTMDTQMSARRKERKRWIR